MKIKSNKMVIGALLTLGISALSIAGFAYSQNSDVESALLKPTITDSKTIKTPPKVIKPKKTRLNQIRYMRNGKNSSWNFSGNNYGIVIPTCNGRFVILQPNDNGLTATPLDPNTVLPAPPVQVSEDNGLSVSSPTSPNPNAAPPIQLDEAGAEDSVSIPDGLQVYVPMVQNPPLQIGPEASAGSEITFPNNHNGGSVTFHPPVCLIKQAPRANFN